MSLEHVERYVLYVDGKRAIPANVRPHMGKTFCEEPIVTNPNPTASVGGESFFDAWEEDEAVAEGEDSADLGLTSNRSAISPVGLDVPSQTVLDAPQPERQNTTPTIDNTAMDLEVIDLLRKHRPELLAPYPQERIHRAVTSDQHQGKSGDAYVDYVLSVAKFVAHPGMASRAYDLQFGKHGLSIMHFKRMGFLDKLRALAPGTVNTADYLVAAPPPMQKL
ncbi:hypothetical protein PHMEG_00040556 [Phytophthora megakarya]|uniref:Uncharacterized protein n=1 Tax=Phytophthora megakarya TaxID=4795 RepID=A0A225UDC0_9STRA|nr:hypothetical protein PHMEG_00040556 [Phytophthora megakarya]